MKRTAEWRTWVASLKTGDEVGVFDVIGDRPICTTRVTVTPTGRVHIGGHRHDWRESPLDLPGAGPRYIDKVRP